MERADAELTRLKSLQQARTERWNVTGQLERAVREWLADGAPKNCELVAVEDEAAAELMKRDERITDAVERYRHRLRELQADLRRVRSAPFTSAAAKARVREQINQLADAAAPDASRCIPFLEEVKFATVTARSTAQSFDPKGAPSIVFSETPDLLGLLCWLHRDQMIERIEGLIDVAADDAHALSELERQEMEAQISSDMLAVERSEVALIRYAEARGEVIDYRRDCSPAAVLGVELIVRRPTEPGRSTSPLAYDLVVPGGRLPARLAR